ncbi:hypothetical protein MMC09_002537 [Bachmanniomyces sp. S44760]|nr:hypothetical protein [Bachmanniomyces sp. S44760]
MPEQLKASEVDSKTDPTVAKQFDTETPLSEQIQEFYKTVDGMKVGLLTTIRPSVGPVSRSMAVSKRNGPGFLFIANAHSQKFDDLKNDKTAQVTFQNSSSQDWVSVTGKATTVANDDPRIKELYSPPLKAWFGDLGDGIHTGTAEDPRMSLIEVKADFITYWKSSVSSIGFVKEVAVGAMTGKVANTGVTRQFQSKELEQMRKDDA